MILGASVRVREFTSAGIRSSQDYLREIREGGWRPPGNEILFAEELTVPVSPAVTVENRTFEDRRELGQYLEKRLKPLGHERVSNSSRLLSWLGMFYLESLTGGKVAPRRAFAEIAHLIDPQRDSRDQSHHRIKMAYDLWTSWGEGGWFLIDQPANSMPQFTLRVVQSPEIMRAESIVPLALDLYVDRATSRLRPGSTGMSLATAPPGSLPRLIAVLRQLSMTYDIYGMNAAQLLDLLPAEFERFSAPLRAP